jgi:hypothetical protein
MLVPNFDYSFSLQVILNKTCSSLLVTSVQYCDLMSKLTVLRNY